MKKLLAIIIFVSFLLSSCFQRQLMLDQEHYQILSFIQRLGIDFDTLPSGVLYHIDTVLDTVNPRHFRPDEEVMLVYTGKNLDQGNRTFVENDTVYVKINDPLLLEGWREILLTVPKSTVGQAIFPFYTAFDKKHVFNIPPYSTLYFTFYADTVPPPEANVKKSSK